MEFNLTRPRINKIAGNEISKHTLDFITVLKKTHTSMEKNKHNIRKNNTSGKLKIFSFIKISLLFNTFQSKLINI